MSSGAQRKSSIDQWRDGLDKATGNRKWDAYDCEIRAIVAEYNSHLQPTPGYRPLDWRLIKAMIWTETGAGSPEWKIKPMQIGVPGDPGMNSLLSGNEGADLILPPVERTYDGRDDQKHSRTQSPRRSRLPADEDGLL
jgi:hypothetical protein